MHENDDTGEPVGGGKFAVNTAQQCCLGRLTPSLLPTHFARQRVPVSPLAGAEGIFLNLLFLPSPVLPHGIGCAAWASALKNEVFAFDD